MRHGNQGMRNGYGMEYEGVRDKEYEDETPGMRLASLGQLAVYRTICM